MMNRIMILLGLAFGVLVLSCVSNTQFEPLEPSCHSELKPNTTFAAVKALYQEETILIQDNLIMEALVVSSDEAGNFFSTLYIQNTSLTKPEGLQIEIETRDAYLEYPPGARIFINLKGLYLGKSKDVFKLGGVASSFGNRFVSRLPALLVQEHIKLSCTTNRLEPNDVRIDSLHPSMTNTLVRLSGVQVLAEEVENQFAEARELTKRTIVNCDGKTITLLNSGFSDFYETQLPKGNGELTGVLIRERKKFFLVIRDQNDINFSNPRCLIP